MNSIKELSQEALEIKVNISNAVKSGEITWKQRDELMNLVNEDVERKLNLARNLLHDWTGNSYSETWAI